MVIQFASTIYLIKLVRAKRVLSNISRCSGIIDNKFVIVYDGIFETFGSKIRDEIPKEVAPVRTIPVKYQKNYLIEFWSHFLGKKISFLALIECGVTFLFFYRNVRQAEPSKISWVIEHAYNSVEKDKLSFLHRRLRQFPIFTLLFATLVSW